MADFSALVSDPGAWAALISLVVMEIVLGIDNLIFISILTNKLPEAQRPKARTIGISLALGMRLALLATLAWIVGLTAPVFNLGVTGPVNEHGYPPAGRVCLASGVRDLARQAGQRRRG